ncbi:MAG: hypothetical protein QM632_02660 [Micrococcaceae bacterium]
MFTGTKELLILILKRERVKLPLWILGITLSLIAMVPTLKGLYGSQESLTSLYNLIGTNPSFLFLTGPMDKPTFGALFTIETLLWWGLAIAFMNTLFIISHTRQDEEIGALELILSARVHRFAGLISALIVAFFANLLITLLIGGGLSMMNVDWQDGNIWLYATSLGLFGFTWAAIAAVIAQLFASSHTANSVLASLIALTFVVRGFGDFLGTKNSNGLLEAAWPSYLSPFGWLEMAKPLVFASWQPLWLFAIPLAVFIPLSFYLLSNRNLGSGIIPARKGKTRASAFLQTPLGLTWKLQKNIFFAYLTAVTAMATMIGSLVPQIANVYKNSPQIEQLFEAMGGTNSMIPAFITSMLVFIVMMVIAYALQALGKLRSEESHGRLEVLLSTKLSRIHWLGLHSLIALFGSAVLLLFSGLLLALSVNASAKDLHINFGNYILSALQYWPIVALFVGLYLLLFGLFPKASGTVTWFYFGFVAFIAWLAPMLNLKQWILNLSPMAHIASAPAQEIKAEPIAVVTLLAAVLIGIGIYFWRNRDVRNS